MENRKQNIQIKFYVTEGEKEYKMVRTKVKEYATIKQKVHALLTVPKEQEQHRWFDQYFCFDMVVDCGSVVCTTNGGEADYGAAHLEL